MIKIIKAIGFKSILFILFFLIIIMDDFNLWHVLSFINDLFVSNNGKMVLNGNLYYLLRYFSDISIISFSSLIITFIIILISAMGNSNKISDSHVWVYKGTRIKARDASIGDVNKHLKEGLFYAEDSLLTLSGFIQYGFIIVSVVFAIRLKFGTGLYHSYESFSQYIPLILFYIASVLIYFMYPFFLWFDLDLVEDTYKLEDTEIKQWKLLKKGPNTEISDVVGCIYITPIYILFFYLHGFFVYTTFRIAFNEPDAFDPLTLIFYQLSLVYFLLASIFLIFRRIIYLVNRKPRSY